jgi:hypothetical protein
LVVERINFAGKQEFDWFFCFGYDKLLIERGKRE